MNKKIIEHLSKDKLLKKAIANHKLPPPALNEEDVYAALIRSIIYQQLSGKAAKTIHDRFLALFKKPYPDAKQLLKYSLEDLRAVGVSRQKAGYLQNVADFSVSEKMHKINWDTFSDDEIIKYLTQIKGVGKWTVQMILMFKLERPDILPLNDLGIQLGMKDLYGIDETGKALKERMVEIAEPWRPYRSYGSRYIWRWKDAD